MFKTFITFLSLVICSISHAQNAKAKFSETSIVKDSTGQVYPFVISRQLLLTGRYTLKPLQVDLEHSEFILVKVSDEEREKRMRSLPKPKGSPVFRDGESFGSFTENDIKGKKYKLKDLRGKVIVINFWFINCPPCRMEIPELNELVAKYEENEDVIFLGIAMDEKYKLEEFLKMMPFRYNIIENGRYLAKQYSVTAFPTHVVVDGEGKVRFHTIGLAMNTVYWINKTIDESLKAITPKTVTVAATSK